MSFTPENPDWDRRFGPKKNPSESLRDLFGSDKVEFEPIDDDEDDIKPPAVSSTETPAKEEPEFVDSTRRSSKPSQPQKGRPHQKDSKRSQPTRANGPEKAVEPATATTSEPAKPTTSHWDFLASTLGLASDQPQQAKPVESKRVQEPIQTTPLPPAREPKKTRQPEPPTAIEDDIPLHELFVPTGEEFPDETPRVIDDVTADEGEDFIEFEVEDLVPNAPKRNGGDRKPRRRRKRRGERTANTSDPADVQAAGVDEPHSDEPAVELQNRPASRGKEPRDRGPRRPEQNRKTEQSASGQRCRQPRESSRGSNDQSDPRNNSGRSRNDSSGSRGDSGSGDSGSGDSGSRSDSRSRGAARDDSRSRNDSGSRGDSGRSSSDSGRTRDDSRRSAGPPPRSRDDSGRQRSDSGKVQQKAPPAREPNFDDEDDFVEIQDNSTNVEKNITTWRQAISVIVEANIDSRSKSKSGGNRGKPRNDRDHRRR
jgi:hypothetical protein